MSYILEDTHYILDDNGEVVSCDLMTWAKWFETHDRIIRQDKTEKHFVSTVFLGLDHNWGQGDPLLFETMIFPLNEDGNNSWGEVYMDRYSTKAEAMLGHQTAMEAAEAMEGVGRLLLTDGSSDKDDTENT